MRPSYIGRRFFAEPIIRMSVESMLAFGALVFVLVLALMRRKPELPKEDFMNLFLTKPTLWFIVDDDAVNSGYIQIALDAAKTTQGADFNVAPLFGRDAILKHIRNPITEAKQLPANLWRLYAIANLLDSQSGLVMDGTSTICVGPAISSRLRRVPAASFGIHPDEAIVSPATATAPGPAPYAGWSAATGHPAWTYAAQAYTELVKRGPQAWSAAEARHIDLEVYESQKTRGLVILRDVDGSRLANGQLRQLEDIFGRINEPADPKISLLPGNMFVSYNGDQLARRHEFNWFMRLSANQIKESDLVWTRLAGL